MNKNNTEMNNLKKKKIKNQFEEKDFIFIENEEKEIDIDSYLNERNKKDKKIKKKKEKKIQNKKLSIIASQV